MSKSKGNVVNPWNMAEKYGMDAVRWYFFSTNHPWDPKLFSERDIQQTLRKFILTFWNSLVFYNTYAPKPGLGKNAGVPKPGLGKNVLDRWIVSRLNTTTADMTKKMDDYDITGAARSLESFVIDDLSLWYIRRSRNRFQNPKSKKELQDAVSTLGYVLSQASLLSAPFIPFLSEVVFEKSKGKGSVHLKDWPFNSAAKRGLAQGKPHVNKKLEEAMKAVREIASKGLALRAKAGLRVRQPLASLKIQQKGGQTPLWGTDPKLLDLIKEELNVKAIIVDKNLKNDIELDTKLTPALREEGLVRELSRHIQGMRKDAGYKPRHRVRLRYTGAADIKNLFSRHKETLAKIGGISELLEGDRPKQVFDVEKDVLLDGKKLWLGIRKL